MYQSNESLRWRYNYLNRGWVNLPVKLQIEAEAEMKAIKEKLAARGASL